MPPPAGCLGLSSPGEVLLADPGGGYLGRTCPWRNCGPSYRSRCAARTCGRRPYLQNDLGNYRLPASVASAPPIELWPALVARVPVPVDLKEALLSPFPSS
jgi:hypothetical protein